MSIVLETTLGDLTIDLYTAERPRAAFNFMKLCRIKYFNLCPVHRVEKDFIIQTGDPTGTGRGGESIFMYLYGEQAKLFEAEGKTKIKHSHIGTVSMVNDGNNLHGSQFFITLAPDLDYLDKQAHTVVGRVVEGLETLEKFNETVTDNDHRPFEDIRIAHTVILEDPFDDPKELTIPPESPIPQEDLLESDRIGLGELEEEEERARLAGLDAEAAEKARREEEREKVAKAEATILEMIGDLPDADMAPPENVLFVCKLNPVTREDDLEVIFSRFGSIKNCEVIRDRVSGESLQYAFIEFTDPKFCEAAYFKMDNVLIDDRRIHVDFSQSVSKVKWRGKGRGVIGSYSANDDQREQRKPRDQKSFRMSGGLYKLKDKGPRGGNLSSAARGNDYKMLDEQDQEITDGCVPSKSSRRDDDYHHHYSSSRDSDRHRNDSKREADRRNREHSTSHREHKSRGRSRSRTPDRHERRDDKYRDRRRDRSREKGHRERSRSRDRDRDSGRRRDKYSRV